MFFQAEKLMQRVDHEVYYYIGKWSSDHCLTYIEVVSVICFLAEFKSFVCVTFRTKLRYKLKIHVINLTHFI